jgi:autotransporter-associated beta strand protein
MTGPLNIIVPAGSFTLNKLTMGITTTPNATDVGNANSDGGALIFSGTSPSIVSGGAVGSTNTITAPVTIGANFTATGTANLSMMGDVTFSGGNRTFDFVISPDGTAGGTVTLNNVKLSEPTATSPRSITLQASGSQYAMRIAGTVSDGGGANSQVGYRARSGSKIYIEGTNTNTGTVTINGNVVIRNDQAFGTGTVQIGSNTVDISSDNGPRTIANNILINSSAGVNFSGANSITQTGFTLLTGGSRTITNNLAAGQTLSFSGGLQVTDSRGLTVAGTGATVINGLSQNLAASAQGIGSLNYTSTGPLALTGANYLSGTMNFSAATVTLGNASALGTAGNVVTLGSGASAAGAIDFNGFSPTVGKHFVVGTNSGIKAALVNNAPNTTVTLGDGISLVGTTATASSVFYTSVPTVELSGGGGTGASVTLNGLSLGQVAGVSGSGYTSVPTATIIGGGGTDAIVKINSLKLANFSVTNPGSGYTAAPTVAISGGGGSGGAATVTMAINTASATLGGTGYVVGDAVTFTGGGATTDATGHVTSVDGSGAITGVQIDTAGAGYTSLPTIAVTSAAGTGATVGADLKIEAITTSTGSGYTSLPTVSLTGGGGAGGTISSPLLALTTGGGGVSVINAGHGFTSVPTITVSGGGGPDGSVNISNLAIDQQDVSVTPGSGYTSAPTVTVNGVSNPAVFADFGQIVLGKDASIGGAGNMIINAVISDGGTARSLNKIGAGRVTLNRANTYTGSTIVQQGTLEVGTAALDQVLNTSAGADIQGGTIVYDYIDPATATTLKGLLSAGYAQTPQFSSGKLRSSNSTANIGLGYSDNGAGKFTVARTYYGDANLDGQVNSLDFNALAGAFNTASGGVWTTGDFNYDGVINALDFNALATNFGAAPLGPGASLGALVPEPTVLGLMGGLAGLCMRRPRERKGSRA